MVAFWIGNYEFFVGSITDCTTHRNLTIYPRYTISIGYQSIYIEDAVDLVLPVRILINSNLLHLSVSFHQKSAGITDVTE